MRIIVQLGKHAWSWESTVEKLAVQAAGDEDGAGEFEQAPPIDPHGTLSAHVEHGPGADSYVSDVLAAGPRKFGFATAISKLDHGDSA